MRSSTVAPPLVELGRLVGWDPLPLSVRDARRQVGPAPRATGADIATPIRAPPSRRPRTASRRPPSASSTVSYGPVVALDGVDLTIVPGEVLVLMGRNGSGKSTLLSTLAGARRPTRGSVVVDGRDPQSFRAADLVRHVGLVPQDPGLLLYGESVDAECQTADKVSALPAGTTSRTLDRVLPGVPRDRHPRDLSEGQRLALALAIVLAPAPASCCSTNRPGGWTTRARIASSRSCANWPGTVTPLCWPPTTWSSPPAWRTGLWSWPTARSSPTARPARWSAIPRSSPLRWPRCWRPKSG